MATLVDSEEVFFARVRACGLGEFVDKFKENKWTTLANFAYSSSYVPGSGDETVFTTNVVQNIFGATEHDLLPGLRRLHFECYTLMASDLKSKVEGYGDGKKVKLPTVEVAKRVKDLRTAYPLLDWKNPQLDLAHKPINKMNDMRVNDRLEWVDPAEVPTREQEMQSKEVDEVIRKGLDGTLKAEEETRLPDADVRTDLKLKNAFTRRGLSYEVAFVMKYTSHEKLINKLFLEYERDPPPGYARVSLVQLANADKKAFYLLQQLTLGDLGNDSAGTWKCDRLMDQVLVDPAFLTLLLPLQEAQKSASAGGESKVIHVEDDDQQQGQGKRKMQKTIKKLQQELAGFKNSGSQSGKGGKGGGATGGGKGGGHDGHRSDGHRVDGYTSHATVPNWTQRGASVRMPRELQGLYPMKNDERICFAFNMANGCNADPCNKGLHVCMRCWSKRHGALWKQNNRFVCRQG